jgi:hypothetical protein
MKMSVGAAQGSTLPVPRAPARSPGRGDLDGGRFGDLAPFGVHPVLARVLDLDRQKRARPDMQRDVRQADLHLRERRKQRCVEMK